MVSKKLKKIPGQPSMKGFTKEGRVNQTCDKETDQPKATTTRATRSKTKSNMKTTHIQDGVHMNANAKSPSEVMKGTKQSDKATKREKKYVKPGKTALKVEKQDSENTDEGKEEIETELNKGEVKETDKHKGKVNRNGRKINGWY